MKKLLCAVCVIAMGAVAVSAAEPAPQQQPELREEEAPAGNPFKLEVMTDIYSAYVWRGCVINDRPVWQPSLTTGYRFDDFGTVSVGAWSNFDITGRNHQRSGLGLNEFDSSADYTLDISDFALKFGHMWYTYPKVNGPDYWKTTREFYTGLAYKNEIVSPSVTAYYDYFQANGWYVQFGLNKEVEVDRFVFGGDLNLGLATDNYCETYYGRGADGGLADFSADLYVSYALTDHIAVGATVAWSSLLGTDARANEVAGWDEDCLWGGINLKASF